MDIQDPTGNPDHNLENPSSTEKLIQMQCLHDGIAG